MTESFEEGLHVVVGATGGTGRVIVRELHAAGRRVRAVNRSGRLPAGAGVEPRRPAGQFRSTRAAASATAALTRGSACPITIGP